ncbi:MAG: hypothetical protein UV71_C0008G0004 [Microgenomates group bacterium GW2011_GWC1_43_13]|uniref:Uncharacterized protein n=2 Tax=Candidatus Woeseibacteriota TaxID=1752722 RepID=A0A837IB28_9BACT|nr:MAG: hypothetical protein UV71_C0008G0004 [Microgenomates group bacterium GW2011_GWC1_43_13]KKT53903.1 MAG: hypothetical protein UW47_C0014G0004 [Candidatus Woesebacteria bacterium GW2011_GWA1_44_23]OGM76227.1 MAG: hypothetical protein A2208_02055 [Candidatus Woesebacteria bacterium RIFOXYA1_FULL_43_16]OGM81918.1 MAG: hypothetical protein A2394_00740 [Candidatus Woesebacteria bacterium RIFOXYB1_FULL_42_36]OGM84009.1 MAG: hypothetical protein A2421_00585 [Candidatus Woesebacteria bacterium RI
MKNLVKIVFALFGITLLVYLAWPAPPFPKTLWDFEPSTEPADKESTLRRGYYTNITRGQLMDHYSQQLGWGERLNYPPEDAQTLIRDQTHATFLEEIVHPMRESLFVAGNELGPKEGAFVAGGKEFKQKVIVKYVTSNVFVRILTGLLTLGLIWILGTEWVKTVKVLKKTVHL